jgi:hypothetical protein
MGGGAFRYRIHQTPAALSELFGMKQERFGDAVRPTNPTITMLVNHLCCSGCLDDMRAALQPLTWVDKVRSVLPQTKHLCEWTSSSMLANIYHRKKEEQRPETNIDRRAPAHSHSWFRLYCVHRRVTGVNPERGELNVRKSSKFAHYFRKMPMMLY